MAMYAKDGGRFVKISAALLYKKYIVYYLLFDINRQFIQESPYRLRILLRLPLQIYGEDLPR